VLSASGSSAEAVALYRFLAARHAGEPDLFVAILDVGGPNAHWRVVPVTPWKQHTSMDSYRFSLHIPSLMGRHGSEKGAKMVDEVLAALRILIEQFPHCFAWHAHRPLKIGIHKDLEARGIDPRVTRLELRRYCMHIAYQHALVKGAIRIDLDGQPAGTRNAPTYCPSSNKI
jgi:hypothetical protein